MEFVKSNSVENKSLKAVVRNPTPIFPMPEGGFGVFLGKGDGKTHWIRIGDDPRKWYFVPHPKLGTDIANVYCLGCDTRGMKDTKHDIFVCNVKGQDGKDYLAFHCYSTDYVWVALRVKKE